MLYNISNTVQAKRCIVLLYVIINCHNVYIYVNYVWFTSPDVMVSVFALSVVDGEFHPCLVNSQTITLVLPVAASPLSTQE